MDTNFNQFFGMRQRPVFMSFTGVITHMEVAGGNMGNYDACAQMLTVENEAGNTVNFLSIRIPLWWIMLLCMRLCR